MPPNGSPPAPPPITPGNNPYDFIVNPGQPSKKPRLPLPDGSSTKARILVVAAGAVILMIIASIVMAILASPNKQYVSDVVSAAQQQEELRRISEIGTKDARGATAKNLAATAYYTMQSDQVTLTPIVNKVKKLDKKTLALGKDEETTRKLTEAKQANRFDDVFTDILKQELQEYQKTLKRVHDGTSNKANKAVLAEQFRNVGILIGEETTEQ